MDVYVMGSDGSDLRRITVDAHSGYAPDGYAGPSWRRTDAAPDEGPSPTESVNVIGGTPEQAVEELKREILKDKTRIAELEHPGTPKGETPESTASQIAYYEEYSARLQHTLERVWRPPLQGCAGSTP